MTPSERFANLCLQFENLSARAAKIGNFLNIEQMFLDAQLYAPDVNNALIRVSGELHLADDFIQPGTTPTEVFFEVYRRVMFSDQRCPALNWTDLADALMHLERLVIAGEVESGTRGDNVVSLFGEQHSARP